MRILPLLLLLTLAACGSSAAAGNSGSTTVDIASFTYKPATVTVKAGDKVTWVNRDTAGHTATFKSGLDTDRLEKGDRKALTFEQPGRYRYVCAFHAFMSGEVVVE
ncbi:MAG TPA: cupredoxin family copper-binding protein [Solirubrobacteraceae bacterium]|nr:cupredoxin family copper-binding protein [Solirubrobacteraceae bacterium]